MTPPCNHTEERLVAIVRQSDASSPISAQELGAALGVDVRRARALVSHLRQDHHAPICSTPAEGFFYPRRAEDARHTLAQLGSRRVQLQATIDGIEEGLRREFGQMDLWGNGAASAVPGGGVR